jgi:hypothetical protein
MNEIVIEQATYGEVNKGHDLILSTFSENKIAKAIKGYTDLFPKAPLNMGNIQSYLSGFDYENYYIISRTFIDESASRSSMVFTHTLWIKKTDLPYVNELEILLELLPTSIDKSQTLATLKIPISNRVLNENPKGYQRKLIGGLVNQTTIIWLNEETFDSALCVLWNNIPAFVRQELRFRLSFSPEDLSFLNPTIVYAPLKSENKWEQGFKVQINDEYESNSLLEAYLLQDEKAVLLFDLEKKLHHPPKSIDDLRLLEQIAKRLETNENSFASTLSLVRLLARYIPNQDNEIKAQQIKQLNQQITFCATNDFSKLRNLDIQPFGNAKVNFINSCQLWLNKSIVGLEQRVFEQFVTTKQSWFQSILIHSIQDKINNWKSSYSASFWNWLNDDRLQSNIKIPNNAAIASDLVNNRIAIITKPLAEKLQQLATQYQWFKLHAIVIPTLYTPKVAIEKQLKLDNSTSIESLELLAENLSKEDFINHTLSNPNQRLITVSGQLCATKSTLFNDFDIQSDIWLAIWIASFANTSDIWKGILQPQNVVFSLLDKLLNKTLSKSNQTILFEKIATSKFNNLFDYPKRKQVWKLLPISTKDSFLKATVWAWLKGFEEDDEIVMESELKTTIQGIIRDIIKSDYSIKAIIKLFETNQNLTENDLKYLIEKRYKDIDDVLLAKRLGKLISSREWKNAFSEIKFSRYKNEIFKFAIDECQNLNRSFLMDFLDVKPTPYFSKQETSKTIREGIYKCLKNGDLDKALEAVKEWNEIENLRKDHEINVFYSRKNRMEDSFRKGTITREEYNKEHSNLVWDLGKTIDKWKV